MSEYFQSGEMPSRRAVMVMTTGVAVFAASAGLISGKIAVYRISEK